MKILRLFDSLKLVLATVSCIFILNVAHADTTAIQSVIAYGKTEQSATPTPTTPVPIMTNNGELKVNKNLFNPATAQLGDISSTNGRPQATTRSILSDFIPIKPNTKYTASGKINIDGEAVTVNRFIYAYYDANKEYIENSRTATTTGTTTITTTNNASYKYIRIVYFAATGTNASIANSRLRFEEGSTATTGVVTNGLTETIRDAAGHKATTQMLLSVGDYKDEQNITTGAITRRVGVKVLDGTEDWKISTAWGKANTNVFYYNATDGIIWNTSAEVPTEKTLTFYTHFQSSSRNDIYNNDIPCAGWSGGVSSFSITIRVYKTINTVDDFKAWLAEQYANGTPVIVVYPLATPTTENVATQSLTTAPVRQTLGAIMNMPIKTILTDNTEIMSGADELIKIATTKYNEESFTDVQDALTGVFNAVDTVVTQTMTQAQAIDTIATTKQTRPDEGCTAKYCLLVEDEDGTPHWYPIAGANGVAHALPAGYTELQYIESTGTQYIDPDVSGNATFIGTAQSTTDSPTTSQVLFANSGASAGHWFGVQSPSAGSSYAKRWGLGATPTASSTIDGTTKVDFEITFAQTSQTGTVNDQTLTRESSAITHTDWIVFAENTTPSYGFIGKVWKLKVVQNDVLVRNLIPAKNSSNVVGMYDMVSGQFFTNQGTGDFTAGPDM